MSRTDERGITLTELTIVMVLAALVTVGLITFYLNSQGLWLDASSQALTQRDATLVAERIRLAARQSAHAIVTSEPDSLRHSVMFYGIDQTTETARFFWDPADSLIHIGTGPSGTDQGPVTTSRVQRFQLETDGNKIVHLVALSMRSTTGEPVELATSMALYAR